MLLHGLVELGISVQCIEGRQAYQALKSMAGHRTDRNDTLAWQIQRGPVNTIQKCHWLCNAEVSPRAQTVARLSSPETSYIAELKSLAGDQ